MRERALFGAMFGLGLVAVAVGVAAVRVIFGPLPEPGENALAVVAAVHATEDARQAASIAATPAAKRARHTAPSVAPAATAARDGQPIVIIRGGASPGARGEIGPRIIRLDPPAQR